MVREALRWERGDRRGAALAPHGSSSLCVRRNYGEMSEHAEREEITGDLITVIRESARESRSEKERGGRDRGTGRKRDRERARNI